MVKKQGVNEGIKNEHRNMENVQICLLSAGFLITRTGWHMSGTHQHGKLKSHQPFSLLKMSYQLQKAAMLCARLAFKT